jgi:hypothetical protein
MMSKRQDIVVDDDNDDEIMVDLEEEKAANDQVRLTKHMSLTKELPPLYTGGSFVLLKNDKHCLAMRESKICVFDMTTLKVLTVIAQENEEILCFAVSPN